MERSRKIKTVGAIEAPVLKEADALGGPALLVFLNGVGPHRGHMNLTWDNWNRPFPWA